ncbi:Chitin synthase, class 3, partial [Borealophlyctis nickersoniae]
MMGPGQPPMLVGPWGPGGPGGPPPHMMGPPPLMGPPGPHMMGGPNAGGRPAMDKGMHLPFAREATLSRRSTLGRKKSLVRPDRERPNGHRSLGRGEALLIRSGAAEEAAALQQSRARREIRKEASNHTLVRKSLNRNRKEGTPTVTCWGLTARIMTFYCPPSVLAACGMRDPHIQQAFREKIALCIIIFLIMIVTGFMIFGFNHIVCRNNIKSIHLSALTDPKQRQFYAIRGVAYTPPVTNAAERLGNDDYNFYRYHFNLAVRNITIDYPQVVQKELAPFFPIRGGACDAELNGDVTRHFSCSLAGTWPVAGSRTGGFTGCHTKPSGENYNTIQLATALKIADLYLRFDELANSTTSLIFNGKVLDLSRMLNEKPNFLGEDLARVVRANLGRDATKALAPFGRKARCLDELFRVATIDADSVGCVLSRVIFFLSSALIMSILAARFILAVFFRYFVAWKLGAKEKGTRVANDLHRRKSERRGKPGAMPAGFTSSSQVQLEMVNVSGKDVEAKGGSPPSMPAPTPPPAGGGVGINRSQSSLTSNSNGSVDAPVKGRDGHLREPTLPSVELPGSDITSSSDDTYTDRFLDPALSAPMANADPVLNDPSLLHTLVMVPCYSEGYSSLRATLDSIAHSYYPSTHKTLFVIADGVVKGVENDKSTASMLVDMMEVDERFRDDDPRWDGDAKAYSYVAIADGSKRKNYAKVYAGWYRYALGDPKTAKKSGKKEAQESSPTPTLRRNMTMETIRNRKEGKVPMILVVKTGNEEEQGTAKPGNRGKRDTQVLLMQFLTKVMFDDRMTELEFDIFHKLWTITGLHPDRYETVLMVDADTRVYPDALTHMVACLVKDPKVMGLCGETKVHNKWASWVTMIQVFEYYVSHHLSKAFESVFGGVTCLPGCFSMYRIKAPKGDMGYYVPVLANPDVVEEYSENVVDTLHKKNLLLLGEDRYLTTLMLRSFPRRRAVFVPQAICKTVVPDSFGVLVSQRRRWINSTIHNLLELVLVRDLCGTFCISMQFVIFMDLIATVVLPAAMVFLLYLLIELFISSNPPVEAVILSAAILGLPAILIIVTVQRFIYIFWLLIYLLALPIWQFILPL